MTKEKNYFHTFCRLSEAFGSAATTEELLDLIVRNAAEVMDGKAACLFLADRKQDVFIPTAQHGLSPDYLHASPIKARKLVAALKSKGHLSFEDATSDPRLEHHEAKKAEGIASILTVPVMVDGRCIGVLSLYTAKRHSFAKGEIEFLKALATNGGITLKKARLLERIEKNSNLFLELASAINSSLEIRQVLANMGEKSCKALGMKGVSIRLLDERTEALETVSSYGLSDDFLAKGPVLAEKSIKQVMQGKTVVIEDITKDSNLQYPEETLKEGIRSIVCVPMRSRESIIGVMRLYSSCVRKYPQDFLTIVEAIAHTGALAIQNASLYLRLKEDKQSLEDEIWSHRSYF